MPLISFEAYSIMNIKGACTLKPIDDLDEQQKNEESTKLKYITPAIQKKWNADGDRIVFCSKTICRSRSWSPKAMAMMLMTA